MIRTRQSLVGAIVVIGALFSTAVSAVAETCTLTLKRRETAPAVFNPTSYMYWTVRPQYIYMQMQAQGTGPWQPANTGGPSQLEAFKRIVTKEPKYQSEYPFRGVVKLGSQEYAFALDVVPPKAKQPDVKTSREKYDGGGSGRARRKGWGQEQRTRGQAGGRRSRISPTTGSISISITTAT